MICPPYHRLGCGTGFVGALSMNEVIRLPASAPLATHRRRPGLAVDEGRHGRQGFVGGGCDCARQQKRHRQRHDPDDA